MLEHYTPNNSGTLRVCVGARAPARTHTHILILANSWARPLKFRLHEITSHAANEALGQLQCGSPIGYHHCLKKTLLDIIKTSFSPHARVSFSLGGDGNLVLERTTSMLFLCNRMKHSQLI